jgi:hypothetical protein
MPSKYNEQGNVNPQIVLQGFGLLGVKAASYSIQLKDESGDSSFKPSAYFGLPVFDALAFKPSSYKDKDNNIIEYGKIVSDFKVDSVLFDVTQQKQIIKTNIQGVSGSVKEYISKGDYQVTIRGVICDQNSSNYPSEQVNQLREFLEVETAVEVVSAFLNDVFNIFNLVIESYNFPQTEGFQNMQRFEIQAISDEPLTLTVLS